MTRLRYSFFLMLALASTANAWNLDGYRQGFMLSLGFGFNGSRTHFESDNNLQYTNSAGTNLSYKKAINKFGVSTTAKVGIGLIDQLAVHYVHYASWFESRNNIAVFSYNADVFSAVHGLGLTYYFSKDAPSFYIMAAAGKAQMRAPFEKKPKATDGGDIGRAANGKGAVVALGWEFYHHNSFELSWSRSEFEDISSNSGDVNIDTNAYSLTYNYQFY